MLCSSLAIQTLACRSLVQSVCIFQSSTWRLVTDARMRTFQKRQTAVLLTLSATSTLHIASMLAATLQNAVCRRKGHTLQARRWRKCRTITLKRLRQATSTAVSVLKRANISFLAHTERRISIQKRISLHCSEQSTQWQRSTICRCFTVATREAATAFFASGFQLDKRVIQHEPLGFHDYNCLQMNAFAVVSDSGTLPEESSFFTSVGHPFPAICIRTSTERPEALDKACFILAGIDEKSLLQAVDTAVEMNKNQDNGIPVPNYVDENVSTKVVKLIQSYTGVVNKMVWRKF